MDIDIRDRVLVYRRKFMYCRLEANNVAVKMHNTQHDAVAAHNDTQLQTGFRTGLFDSNSAITVFGNTQQALIAIVSLLPGRS
jgi:hypothetical protein